VQPAHHSSRGLPYQAYGTGRAARVREFPRAEIASAVPMTPI
jgi:hypothetical protein